MEKLPPIAAGIHERTQIVKFHGDFEDDDSEADAGLFWDALCIWLSQHDLLLEVRPTNYD